MSEKLKFVATLDDQFSAAAKEISKNMGSVVKNATLAAAGFMSIDKAAELARASLEEFKKSELTIARLSATVKAVGDRTAYTSAALQKMANTMQGKTIFSDESIMSAQQVMLTMQNISDEILPSAIKAAQNMSATEEDLASKSFALGKALESPADGFTALKRSGVILGDQSEKLIKQLVEEGKLREAQKVLLSEVEKRYGGVADAMAKTAAGQAIIEKNKISDEMEKLGEALMPLELRFLKASNGVVGFISAIANIGREKTVDQTVDQIKATIKSLDELNRAAPMDLATSSREKRISELRATLAKMIEAEREQAKKSAEIKAAEDAKAAEDQRVAAAAAAKEKAKAHWESYTAEYKMGATAFASIEAENYKKSEDAYNAHKKWMEGSLSDFWAGVYKEAKAEEDRKQALRDKEKAEEEKHKYDMQEMEKTYARTKTETVNMAIGATFDLLEASAKSAEEMKTIRIGEALVDGAAASIAMWRSVMSSSIPYPANVILGGVQQAALIAMTAANVATISQQKFAQGGIVQGATGGDTVPIRAQGGEMMLTREDQKMLLGSIRSGGMGGGGITIAPTVRVDSSMSATEKKRTIRATAEATRDALIELVRTNRLPAGLVAA